MMALSDDQYLALTLYGEARGESVVGKIAVASVIRNRLHTGRWGTNYASVVLAPKQFSCWNLDDPNLAILRQLGNELSTGVTTTDAALRECLWVADGTVRTMFASIVADAMHYYAVSLSHAPAWAGTGTLVETIGGHAFYRGVA